MVSYLVILLAGRVTSDSVIYISAISIIYYPTLTI